MNISIDQHLHGFTVISTTPLPEIEGNAYILRHDISEARLVYLQNEDNNKAFSISFKTPPKDDTGVFHILEHSVLCGSDRFPVKEPFVDLIKSSMQTFLNAMTFPDKTMYPVASTNECDLFNLMDVYLDAVFHPSIYHKKAVFEQEGWHYELAEGESGETLVCNGVVFNEMKGALSDPSSVLYDELQRALFPDTSYAFESGGTPAAIPTLTYEDYLDEHRRHYQLANSYTTLYGNLDIDHALAWLNERYFAPVAKEEKIERQKRAAAGLPELTPRQITIQTPVESLGIIKKMETAPENAVAGAAFTIGFAADHARVRATDILLDALFGSNEAPMKRALLDAGIAEDVSAFVGDGINQPFVVVQLKRQHEATAENLIPTLETELSKLLDKGLDKELIAASISHAEFVMREHEFGIADGVVHAMNCLSGWLYNDDAALDYIRYSDDFSFMREGLENGYFDELARSLFLENKHRASVAIVPIATAGENELSLKLDQLNETLTNEQRRDIVEAEAHLREIQMQPDSTEAKKTLPKLGVADIDDVPAENPLRVIGDAPITCLRHDVATHGIVYAYRYFNAKSISFDDLPYVSLLSLVLGKLPTAHHSAAEIDTLTQGKLGNLSFFTDLYEKADDRNDIDLMFVVSASALESNVSWLADFPREILLETNFSDTEKIRDILQQRKIYMEQSFANAGNTRAMSRVRSYYSSAGVILEELNNIGFYRFIKRTLAIFDDIAPALSARLAEIAQRLFVDDNCTLSFTGSDAAYEAFWAANPLCERKGGNASLLVAPAPQVRNEAFVVATDVTYSSMGYDRRLLGLPYTGAWIVGAKALTYDHLWNEVRVKGGAYGVGFQSTFTGNMRFYSYRDPHIDETLARFADSAKFLRNFSPSKTELEGFIVSSVADFDTPKKARDLIRRQDGAYFAKHSENQREIVRKEIIETSIDAVRSLAGSIEQLVQKDMRCVFGNKEIIQSSKSDYDIIDLLNE